MRWASALVIPALPFLVATYAGVALAVDAQRFVLLALVAAAAAFAGATPGLLAAAVATFFASYDPVPPGRWLAADSGDVLLIVAFAVCAVVVALLAGSAQRARGGARLLERRLAQSELTVAEERQRAERLAGEASARRAEAERVAAELAIAREDVARADRARWAAIESLPVELRGPHVAVPAPLQLFPPMFTVPPLGAAGLIIGEALTDERIVPSAPDEPLDVV